MDEFDYGYWTCRYSASLETVDSDSADSGSGSGSGSDSDSDTVANAATKRVRRIYRPKSEREKLEKLLYDWRLKIRADDPTTMLFPLDDILSSRSITNLSHFKPGDLETSSATSITDFIDESEEWNSIYAPEVYDIIQRFNSIAISRAVKTIKKPKRTLPQHEFMQVLDFGLNTPGQVLKRRKTLSDNSAASSSRTPLSEVSLNKVSQLIFFYKQHI